MNKNFKSWLEEQDVSVDSSSSEVNSDKTTNNFSSCGKDFFKNWYYTKKNKKNIARRKNG